MPEAIFCRRRGCDTAKVERIDALGRVSFVCEPCEKNRAGLCRDCPSGRIRNLKCLRCPSCARKRYLATQMANYRKRVADPVIRNHINALARKRGRKAEHRARRRAYMAERRKTHPRPPVDEFDRAYKRAWQRQARKDPAYRAKVNARRRELAAERKQRDASFVERERARFRTRRQDQVVRDAENASRQRRRRRQRERAA